MRLTPKQEKFCQCVVSGMSYKDAYLTAYDTKTTDKAVRTESSKLALRDDIQQRIMELSKPLQQAAQIEGLNAREKQIQYIQSRIELCEQKEDEQSIIRYTDMLNKINNLYKETDNEIKQENNVNNLDISTLKRLSGVS